MTGFMALRYQFSGELEDNMSKYWISGPEFEPGISKMTSVNVSTQHNIEYVLVFHACHILRHIHCTLYTYIAPTLCFSIIPLLYAIANAVPPLHCGTVYVTMKAPFTKEPP